MTFISGIESMESLRGWGEINGYDVITFSFLIK
jgi:hypothetical protein